MKIADEMREELGDDLVRKQGTEVREAELTKHFK